MGLEYTFACKQVDIESTRQFLNRRFITASADGICFELAVKNLIQESKPLPGQYPVYIMLTPGSIYFLDRLISSVDASIIFRQLVDFLLSTEDKVSITEL